MIPRLLIMGCSKAKVHSDTPLPAFQLYDGPRWRIFRNIMPTLPVRPKVIVLSAKYGIIRATTLLPYYDKQWKGQSWMNDLEWVRPQYIDILRPMILPGQDIFVAAGEAYRGVLESCGILRDVVKVGAVYHAPVVSLGVGLQKLRAWLLGEPI